jgi:3-oxoacyl-[acyl-carrier-protein] synthase-1
MSVMPLALSSFGLVTGVGLNAPSTCAAIRCAMDNFQETRFMDSGGEWIMGCEVPLEQPWRGKTKLIKMLARALQETLTQAPEVVPEETPLLLCLPESDRPGRVIDDDNQFFLDLCAELNLEFHEKSKIVPQGHVSIATALLKARKLFQELRVPQVLIIAADSLLVGPTLAAYEDKDRLLTSQNSNGFIPGEAGAALLVRPAGQGAGPELVCTGLGFGIEKATVNSEEPLRADGLASAIKAALSEVGCDMGALDFRITDVAGEQYHFKEASLALSRILRTRKAEFDIWHPADCVGEVGAASGLIIAAVGAFATHKEYDKGKNILLHLGNDGGQRAAVVSQPSSIGSS